MVVRVCLCLCCYVCDVCSLCCWCRKWMRTRNKPRSSQKRSKRLSRCVCVSLCVCMFVRECVVYVFVFYISTHSHTKQAKDDFDRYKTFIRDELKNVLKTYVLCARVCTLRGLCVLLCMSCVCVFVCVFVCVKCVCLVWMHNGETRNWMRKPYASYNARCVNV